MYLLDTNVVSELRRTRPHGAVLAWLETVAAVELHLSAVTIGEIQSGIEAARENDASKARQIEIWLEQVVAAYSILPMDARTFRIWARLMHRQPSQLAQDAMIAATAIASNLTVATRNTRDFQRFDIPVLNPFAVPP